MKTADRKHLTWQLPTNREPTEHEEQRDFVRWFRQTFPGVLIFAIPNGGLRNKITAQKLKAEGVTPGVPDLFIPEWRLFIEMKRANSGTTSELQDDIMHELRLAGYHVRVAYGSVMAQQIVREIRGES